MNTRHIINKGLSVNFKIMRYNNFVKKFPQWHIQPIHVLCWYTWLKTDFSDFDHILKHMRWYIERIVGEKPILDFFGTFTLIYVRYSYTETFTYYITQ